MSHTILIIDDDVYIGDALELYLRAHHYHVLRAYSGTEALLLLKTSLPDLILLDLMLPGMNGEQLLTRIADIPVIVVSAKITTEDKVQALLQGANDYITKPFDSKELLARIQVQLRSRTLPVKASQLSFDLLCLDLTTRKLSVGEQMVHLTKTEFAILKLLLQHPASMISKSQMLDAISMDTPDGAESSLKVHISNLRSKIRQHIDHDYIETIWGIGFRLRTR